MKVFISIVLILFILGAAGAGGYYIYENRPKPHKQEELREVLIPVRTAPLRTTPFRRQISLLGTARAQRQAEIQAEVSGSVTWISPDCELGLPVKAGQELVRLDTEPYRIALEQAKASLTEKIAAVTLLGIENSTEKAKLEQVTLELEAAENEYQRKLKLHGRGVVATSELDSERKVYLQNKNAFLTQESRVSSSEALLLQSEAARMKAEADRDTAALNLRRATLRAPFDGHVASRSVDLGDRLQVGAEAFSVVDFSTVIIDLDIPSHYLDLARIDGKALVSARKGGRQYEGVLKYISPRANNATRLFGAQVYVPNPSGKVVNPGQFVHVSMLEPVAGERMVLPFAALTEDGKGVYVFLVADNPDKGGPPLARKQYVNVLWQQGQQAVVEGLEPGGLLVTHGQEDLVDGAPLRVLENPPSEGGGADRS